jgi:hypothetical protein
MNYLLTCHTEGCENGEIAIPLFTDADAFMCGACGQMITDVQPVL